MLLTFEKLSVIVYSTFNIYIFEGKIYDDS
jgi:hypothetical protein